MLNKKEIEVIFRTHYKDLLNYAYTFTGNIHFAEEIVQEVFLSVWEQRNKIEIDRSLKNYLMGAVKNKSINLKTRYINKYKQFENIEEYNITASQEIKYDENEFNFQIRESIKMLPQQCRTIFLLSRFTSLTYPEIAKHLDISVKTVETQISLALKKLKHSIFEFK